MFKKLALALCLSVAVGACASEEGFRQAADGFVGKPDTALVARLGPPVREWTAPTLKEAGDTSDRFMMWRREVVSVTPGYGGAFCYGLSCSSYYIPPTQGYYDCQIVFKVENRVVTSYTYSGNSCRG